MRDVKIGDKDVRVTASPVTLFIYKKEFGTDIVGDLIGLSTIAENPANMDGCKLMQMAWAMAKTVKLGDSFPNFETWLSSFEYLDFSDDEMTAGIVEEAQQGLFRDREASQ